MNVFGRLPVVVLVDAQGRTSHIPDSNRPSFFFSFFFFFFFFLLLQEKEKKYKRCGLFPFGKPTNPSNPVKYISVIALSLSVWSAVNIPALVTQDNNKRCWDRQTCTMLAFRLSFFFRPFFFFFFFFGPFFTLSFVFSYASNTL